MTEEHIKAVTLSVMERAATMAEHPSVIVAALYQGWIIALATHFPATAHGIIADAAHVGRRHLDDALARGGTKQ